LAISKESVRARRTGAASKGLTTKLKPTAAAYFNNARTPPGALIEGLAAARRSRERGGRNKTACVFG
jgi:hypothetical protein